MDIMKANAVLQAILAARQPDALQGLTLTDFGNEYWISSPPIEPTVQNAIRSALGARVVFAVETGDAVETNMALLKGHLSFSGGERPLKAAADEIARLRSTVSTVGADRLNGLLDDVADTHVMHAAADEIERLRANIVARQEADARFGRELRAIADVLDPQ